MQNLNVVYQVCVYRPDEKNQMISRSGWDIFNSSSKTAEQNSKKLDKKQGLNVLYHVYIFRPIVKLRWPTWPRIGWYIFDFSETAEQISKKVDRKQDLNVHYHQVSVVWADKQVNMAAAASDRLIHFLLPWNRRTEFNETWQEARSQCTLQSLCFSCRL